MEGWPVSPALLEHHWLDPFPYGNTVLSPYLHVSSWPPGTEFDWRDSTGRNRDSWSLQHAWGSTTRSVVVSLNPFHFQTGWADRYGERAYQPVANCINVHWKLKVGNIVFARTSQTWHEAHSNTFIYLLQRGNRQRSRLHYIHGFHFFPNAAFLNPYVNEYQQ